MEVAIAAQSRKKLNVVSITVAPRLSYSLGAEWVLTRLAWPTRGPGEPGKLGHRPTQRESEIFRMVPKFRGFETKMHFRSLGPYSLVATLL